MHTKPAAEPPAVHTATPTAPPASTAHQAHAPGPTNDPQTEDGARTSWVVLALALAAQILVVLDISVVNTALPSIGRDLALSGADMQWVVTAYILAFGSLLLLGGRIADFWGRKRAFVVGLLGFAGASAIGGLAPSQEYMFAARGLQGIFAALLAPAALSLVTVAFTEPKERAKAFGVFGALSGAGAAIGLIVGGLLTDGPGWRWVMWVNVPIALVTAVLAVVIVHESKAGGHPHFDIPGAALATVGLFSLVYGFTRVSEAEHGWADPLAISCLAGITNAAFRQPVRNLGDWLALFVVGGMAAFVLALLTFGISTRARQTKKGEEKQEEETQKREGQKEGPGATIAACPE